MIQRTVKGKKMKRPIFLIYHHSSDHGVRSNTKIKMCYLLSFILFLVFFCGRVVQWFPK